MKKTMNENKPKFINKNWLEKLKLRRVVDYDEVFRLYNMGYSDVKISKMLKCCANTILYIRYKNNLPANYKPFHGENIDPKKGHEETKLRNKKYRDSLSGQEKYDRLRLPIKKYRDRMRTTDEYKKNAIANYKRYKMKNKSKIF